MVERISDRDHTFLRTDDDIFFCVAGSLHAEDAIYGQPYYFLTTELEDIMDIQINEFVPIKDQKFSKLMNVIKPTEYSDFIRDNYPAYYYSPPMWEVLMKVDRSKVTEVIDPQKLVKKFRAQHAATEDEENSLLYTLNQMARFDTALVSNVGITGSLLLHEQLSLVSNDVDLVVYNRSNIDKAKDFSNSMTNNNPRFTGLEDKAFDNYLSAKSKRYPGTREQLMKMTKGRWDTIFVDGMKLDFTFSGTEAPIDTYSLLPNGKKHVRGRVVNASDSYFLPTVLDLEGDALEKVVITSRGYICLFQRDDILDVYGEEFYSSENDEKVIVIDEQKKGYITHAE